MAARAIVGFRADAAGDFVARLACGHEQHVRHRPPLESRPWVTTETGRTAQLGATLDCTFCEMPRLPAQAVVYKQTRDFDERTVPAALLADHHTREHTWGRIVVLEGRLLYELFEPAPTGWVLRPDVPGIIAPGVRHRVGLRGPVRFRVEFLREPGAPDAAPSRPPSAPPGSPAASP